jgi:hypothetical protein
LLAKIVNLGKSGSDEFVTRVEVPANEGASAERLKEGQRPMLRVVVGLLVLSAVSGCHFTAKQAGYCDNCLPPPVAGKYWYHRKLDNCITSLTAQNCACRDLRQFKHECGPVSCDFRYGYTQAYIDLAFGRPACVPAVPPPKYWHAWYRSCGGRDAVEEWYAGYRAGLDHGVNGGVNHFNRIVPNPDGCCVSAAYISPYARPATPNIVRPLNGQTITQKPMDASGQVTPAVAEEVPPAGTGYSPDNSAGIGLSSGPQSAPFNQ